ncbi:MAG: putative toxin-antitoxin system toxin component, PIN family [Candidatus Woesearchaeota archaeon]
MLRVVLDTNVLVSAAIYQGNEYEVLQLIQLARVQLLLSEEIIQEFTAVLKRPKFGFSTTQVVDVIKQLRLICEVVHPKKRLEVIQEDLDDNKFLECALEGKADYILSGDKHLLKLKHFEEIPIINASKFIALLKEEL